MRRCCVLGIFYFRSTRYAHGYHEGGCKAEHQALPEKKEFIMKMGSGEDGGKRGALISFILMGGEGMLFRYFLFSGKLFFSGVFFFFFNLNNE